MPAQIHRPESVLEGWEGWGVAHDAPAVFFEFRRDAVRFLAWLRSRREYSSNSLYRYLVQFRKLAYFLAVRGLRLEEYDINAHLEAVRSGVYTSSAMPKLVARFLWETTNDERFERLYRRVKAKRGRSVLPEVLSAEEVGRLISAVAAYGFDVRVLVEVVYETGARVGEILQLRVRDVEFNEYGARLYIRRSKSVARTVPVVVYAADLQRLVEGRGEGKYVFPRHYNTYLRYVRMAWRDAGLPEIHRKFHVLRHTRATELYGKLTEKEMMIVFGWRSRNMLDVYAKLTPDKVEEHYLEVVGARVRKAEEGNVRCPRCGHVNPPAAKYCLRCGLPLSSEGREKIAKREAELRAALEELRRLAEELGRLKQQLEG